LEIRVVRGSPHIDARKGVALLPYNVGPRTAASARTRILGPAPPGMPCGGGAGRTHKRPASSASVGPRTRQLPATGAHAPRVRLRGRSWGDVPRRGSGSPLRRPGLTERDRADLSCLVRGAIDDALSPTPNSPIRRTGFSVLGADCGCRLRWGRRCW